MTAVDPTEALRAFVVQVVDERLTQLTQRPNDEYLSTADAAKLAGVAPVTIRRWLRKGELREHRAGRELRVLRADLEKFLRSGRPRNDSSTPEQRARARYG